MFQLRLNKDIFTNNYYSWNVIFVPSLKFLITDLSESIIFPTTFTGEYGLISPLFPIGVGPKKRHIAFPLGQ